MKTYLEKNQKFFNFTPGKYDNLDKWNTNFLWNYDFTYWLHLKNQEIENIFQSLERIIKEYTENQKIDLDNVQNEIEQWLSGKERNKEEIQKNCSNSQSKKSVSVKSNSKWIKNPNSQNTENCNNNYNKNILMHEPVTPSEVNYENITPYKQFFSISNKLNKNMFEEINARVLKYSNQIDTFRRIVFSSYHKNGNFKEIERWCSSCEFSQQKGADILFTNRQLQAKGKPQTKTELVVPKERYHNKDDVIWNNDWLLKYYSYLILNSYETHFRIVTKELQSSHADLMIKVNEDDEGGETTKIIEGTNQISIYDKKSGTITKYALKLTKNPFGYTKFPIGSRSLLIGDKLYITGGKDELQEYRNVIIFDWKTHKIKRIMDMRVPHSYHTMIYNDVFDTIMVLGGEKSSVVEIFDPLANRWQFLPELHVPRAGLLFHFDRPRGFWFAMFGKEGLYKNDSYSDVIEYLDLARLNQGWMIFYYNNKSEIDLRSLMNIYPWNEDLVLLYGGVTFRKNTKSICIWNIARYEVVQVDNKIMDVLMIKAQNSRRWKSIVSGLTSCASSLSTLKK